MCSTIFDVLSFGGRGSREEVLTLYTIQKSNVPRNWENNTGKQHFNHTHSNYIKLVRFNRKFHTILKCCYKNFMRKLYRHVYSPSPYKISHA